MSEKRGIDRVPTGIPGFDVLVEGGFPRNSSVLIAGGPGACKSIFCLQYLYNGATKFNEPGLFIAFEEPKKDLFEQAIQFGWDMEKLEKEGKIIFFEVPMREISTSLFQEMKKLIKKHNIKRIAIDSLSDMCFSTKISSIYVPELPPGPVTNEYQVMRVVQVLINEIKRFDCTNLFVSDSIEKGEYLTRDGVSEFVCDGVVFVNFESLGGEFSRTLLIRKMRRTKNDEDLHPLEINDKGLKVHNVQE